MAFARVDCNDPINNLFCLVLNIENFPTIRILSTKNLSHLQTLDDVARQNPSIKIDKFGWDKYRDNSVEYTGLKKHSALIKWIRDRLCKYHFD